MHFIIGWPPPVKGTIINSVRTPSSITGTNINILKACFLKLSVGFQNAAEKMYYPSAIEVKFNGFDFGILSSNQSSYL